ncbi:MAG: hypothetical protein HKP27_05390, partial [Myxococcales bacterium]|nr:hypothetical protein [Myxococcales bacterium]
MRRLLVPAAKLARALWDDLFPPTCPGCDVATASADFCRRCRSKIEFIDGALCARCQAQPAAGEALCTACRRCSSALDAVHAGALYRGLCSERMRSFKYPPTARLFDPGPEHFAMRLILEAARRAGPTPDAVVPVPHHPRRLR